MLCAEGVLSEGINRLGHEAENSPPATSDVNNERSCTSIHPYAFNARRETTAHIQHIARFIGY
jgi:hypothetical protein